LVVLSIESLFNDGIFNVVGKYEWIIFVAELTFTLICS
jgi:hypothetical protein